MIHRLALALLAAGLLAGCEEQRRSAASAMRQIVEEMNRPKASPRMVGNYRLKLVPGQTGRGGLAILAAGDGQITVRGQYEATGGGREFRAIIPEQTVEAVFANGALRAQLAGEFYWRLDAGPQLMVEKEADFLWDGENLPQLQSQGAPGAFRQVVAKVSLEDAAISTAPVHAEGEAGNAGDAP